MNISERIKSLRIKNNISDEYLANILGITISSYMDLEFHDGEIINQLGFHEATKLARFYGMKLIELLEPDKGKWPKELKSPKELNQKLIEFISSNKKPQEMLEDEVGWYLTWFLNNPYDKDNLTIGFIQDLCNHLNLNWLSYINNQSG